MCVCVMRGAYVFEMQYPHTCTNTRTHIQTFKNGNWEKRFGYYGKATPKVTFHHRRIVSTLRIAMQYQTTISFSRKVHLLHISSVASIEKKNEKKNHIFFFDSTQRKKNRSKRKSTKQNFQFQKRDVFRISL